MHQASGQTQGAPLQQGGQAQGVQFQQGGQFQQGMPFQQGGLIQGVPYQYINQPQGQVQGIPYQQPMYQGQVGQQNQNEMIRCKIPSPFEDGYADILVDPMNFIVMPPSQEKKGFFDKMVSEATNLAQKATVVTKNYVDNRKAVICIYCTAFQTIDNNQLNFYCTNCRYLNNKIWTPPRKTIFCGNCSTKQQVDLGQQWSVNCTKCQRLNLLPRLKPMFIPTPTQPCLNIPNVDKQNQQAQQAYQQQLQQQNVNMYPNPNLQNIPPKQ